MDKITEIITARKKSTYTININEIKGLRKISSNGKSNLFKWNIR